MDDFQEIATQIITKVNDIPAKNRNQELIKLAIISYLYHSFRSEETFEQNVEQLKIKRKQYERQTKRN
jgi:hypothetical protein